MEAIKMVPYIVLTIAIAGLIAGVGALSISQFGNTMQQCWNSSWTPRADNQACLNASPMQVNGQNLSIGFDGLNLSNEYYTKAKSADGIGTIAEQIPTVAIIAIMVIVISIIAGAFVYMRYFG